MVGLVIELRIQIVQKSLVVLRKVFNLKMLLRYVRKKPYSVASILGDPSDTPKEKKNNIVSSPEIKVEVKSLSEFSSKGFSSQGQY